MRECKLTLFIILSVAKDLLLFGRRFILSSMREYRAHETHRMKELDGVLLADFWQRACAFTLDATIAFFGMMMVLFIPAMLFWGFTTGWDVRQHRNFILHLDNDLDRIIVEVIVQVLFFGIATWYGNGQTPGKRLFGIRVVSLVHAKMSFWHSIERALGYNAAALEGGFGFVQFFIHPYRRTVQDRIAETIVVKERSYQNHIAAAKEGAAE